MANRESFPVSPVKLITQINFTNPDGPEDTNSSVSVTGLSWINPQSVIAVLFTGGTGDHPDPEDAMVEGLTAYAGDIIPGVGFTIYAYAPEGTQGEYRVMAIVIA